MRRLAFTLLAFLAVCSTATAAPRGNPMAQAPWWVDPTRAERLRLVRFAVHAFGSRPRTGVYIDIGAGDWLGVRHAADLLRRAGVAEARGFALNATHFDWTANEIAYGRRLSRLVGDKHFIVNTA